MTTTGTPLRSVAAELQAGRLSAMSLAKASIAQRQAAASVLDAYAHWDPESMLNMARSADEAFARGEWLGRLQGIPVSIKDLFGVANMPIHAGSPRRLPAKFEIEGPIITKLREQRAVLTGKTHTSEMGFGVCGANIHWGTPRNPWDAIGHRPAGGSSSGAAISILEGSALMALGSDTGGSAREPANMTGIVGLKITHARWSSKGLIPPGPSLHGPGLLTRTVADAAFAFSALDDRLEGGSFDLVCEQTQLTKIRIGVLDDFFWSECEPGIAEAVRGALDELAAAGARIEPFELPEARELKKISADWDWGVSAVELSEFMQSELPEWMETLHPGARRQLRSQENLSAIEYLRRCRQLFDFARRADSRFEHFDVVVCPTSPMSPPLLDELSDPDRYKQINRLAPRNMCVANLLDLCAITMPVGLDPAGLPIGLQLLARHSGEETLLAAACAFEKVLGTGSERLGTPPLCLNL
jgi:aspartyl-tRNA(Asn)/glutamyl-tRNA(Gln) amidotransferase subunit A